MSTSLRRLPALLSLLHPPTVRPAQLHRVLAASARMQSTNAEAAVLTSTATAVPLETPTSAFAAGARSSPHEKVSKQDANDWKFNRVSLIAT
jgi:hypothetical protein